MSNDVQKIVTYLALVLQHYGGEVHIPIEEIEKGLPAGHGVHMEQDDEGNLTMSIRGNQDEH